MILKVMTRPDAHEAYQQELDQAAAEAQRIYEAEEQETPVYPQEAFDYPYGLPPEEGQRWIPPPDAYEPIPTPEDYPPDDQLPVQHFFDEDPDEEPYPDMQGFADWTNPDEPFDFLDPEPPPGAQVYDPTDATRPPYLHLTTST